MKAKIKSALMTLLIMGLFTLFMFAINKYPRFFIVLMLSASSLFLVSLTYFTFLSRYKRDEENKK